MSPAAGDGTRIAALLNEKLSRVRQYLDATRAQTRLIESESFDELGQNLERRDRLIEEINAIDAQAAPLLASFAEAGAPLPDAAQAHIGQLRACLEEIKTCDEQNTAMAEKRLSQIVSEAQESAKSNRGLRAYLKNSVPDNYKGFDVKK